MEYLFRGQSSHYRKLTVVKCIYNMYTTMSTRARISSITRSFFQVTRSAYLCTIIFSHLPKKESWGDRTEINSDIISSRIAIFRWRIVEADARDARDISRRYDSVNLIPYRAQRDTAIYHCSMFRVTETFMDVVRAAAYYLPRILLFNTV